MKYLFSGRRPGLCLVLAFLLCFMSTLSGCALLPQEEEYYAAPITQEQEAEEYVMSMVMRGDIIVTQTVRASYVPSASESLSFPVGGERIANVYVSIGDVVKAGDLLMELDVSSFESQKVAQQDQLDSLNLSLTHMYNSMAIDLEEAALMDEQAAENETPGWVSRSGSVASSYYSQINSLTNAITVASARLTELEQEIEKRQLYASIDGMVSQMYQFYDGERCVKDKQVITIANMEEALFEVYSNNGSLLEEGKTYVLTAGKTEYNVTCVMGESLDYQNVKPEGIYLKMEVSDPNLKRGEGGTVTIVTKQKLNTLYVPKSALQTVQGQTVAYIPDESGFRKMVTVTTGLSNDTVVEIISGLEEGDTIILP